MNLKHWCKRKCFSLYMKIVREKASPEYIARGWAIGMFFGCLIPFGFQLICSIPAAFILKGSKIGATLGTLLTNQVTIFFIYPVQCYVGSRIMGSDLTYSAILEFCWMICGRMIFLLLPPIMETIRPTQEPIIHGNMYRFWRIPKRWMRVA